MSSYISMRLINRSPFCDETRFVCTRIYVFGAMRQIICASKEEKYECVFKLFGRNAFYPGTTTSMHISLTLTTCDTWNIICIISMLWKRRRSVMHVVTLLLPWGLSDEFEFASGEKITWNICWKIVISLCHLMEYFLDMIVAFIRNIHLLSLH